MREKLIEILYNLPTPEPVVGIRAGKKLMTAGFIADHLIANGVTVQKWNPGKKPPKEWKDEKGDAINFLAVIPGIGVDIANWIEPTRCWFCFGSPCKVTHWMPLPEPPKED